MTVAANNENRIRALEQQVSRLLSLVESLRGGRDNATIDQIIRPARLCEPSTGSYPTTGDVMPIQFLDSTHEGLPSNVTLTERSSEQQAVAGSLHNDILPVESDCFVVRYGRKWFVVPPGMPLKLIKAPSDGIPGRIGTLLGSATCDVWVEPSGSDNIEDSGVNVMVMNWSVGAACANGDRYGIAGWCNNGWYVIAEDCADTGSEVNSFSTGTFNDIPDDFDDEITPPSSTGIFPEITVSFSTGAGFDP